MSLSVLSALVALSPAAQTIEVPFRLGENAIIADVTVNGKKVSLMFDTGFSGTIVLNDTINVGPATGTMTLVDFVGSFTAKTVAVKSLKIGEKNLDTAGMEIVQQPAAHYSMSYGTHVDGILGLQAISHSVTTIDFQRQRFVFHPDSHDVTKLTPDNQRTFLSKMLPKGNNSIELSVVAVNGKKMTLALDTGNAFYATTHKDVLERIGLWPEGKKPDFMGVSMVASGPVGSYSQHMADAVIFGVPVKSSVWDIIDLPASSADHDGTVGFGFLKNFNVTIDMERRRVWLENWTGRVSDPAPAEPGFIAFFDQNINRMRVWHVTPAGPAEKAGIKPGDHLIGLNGKEVTNVAYREMRQLLEGEPGTKIQVSVSRGGQLMRFELERQLLVNGLP
jgi:hypothetical protein